jgi:hypothetical protein
MHQLGETDACTRKQTTVSAREPLVKRRLLFPVDLISPVSSNTTNDRCGCICSPTVMCSKKQKRMWGEALLAGERESACTRRTTKQGPEKGEGLTTVTVNDKKEQRTVNAYVNLPCRRGCTQFRETNWGHCQRPTVRLQPKQEANNGEKRRTGPGGANARI